MCKPLLILLLFFLILIQITTIRTWFEYDYNYKIFFQIFHLVDMGLLWNKLKALIVKSRHFTVYIQLFMFSFWLYLCDWLYPMCRMTFSWILLLCPASHSIAPCINVTITFTWLPGTILRLPKTYLVQILGRLDNTR